MKENVLNKRIEKQAIKFKTRAVKSPKDMKRHDPVMRDEKKCMWIARKQLGWPFAKIGSVFNRDPRTAKDAVESYKAIEQAAKQQPYDETPHKQEVSDKAAQPEEHWNDLAQTAKVFAHRVQMLVTHKDIYGNIVDGLYASPRGRIGLSGEFWEAPYEIVDGISMQRPIIFGSAMDLLHHFNQLYPDLAVQDWKDITTENANQEIVAKLSLLARSKAFKYCLECEVCQML